MEATRTPPKYNFYDDQGNANHAEFQRAYDSGDYETLLECFCHEGCYTRSRCDAPGLVKSGICSESIEHQDTPEATQEALRTISKRLIDAKAEGC